MRIPIEIETTEDRLAFDLFEATTLAVGISMLLPGNAVLTFRGVTRKPDPGGLGALRLEIGVEQGASIGQAAAWLCRRVEGRASAIRIGGTAVEVEAAKVEHALNQHAGK